MNRLFFIFIINTLGTFSNAQINPPDFICVENDTLFWNLPNNSCGPFIGYEIFVSEFPNGPFQVLDTIFTQSQTSYFPGNLGSLVRYYYLVSIHDCPGEMQISSDTLDNRPPEISSIQSASVENGLVQLSWYPSPSPEVIGYIIYRETDIGTVPIDTVYNGLSYTDTNASPNDQSESYFVNALDECGNSSIFDVAHHTIFLESEIIPCEQAIRLNWNFYENWNNGIGQHEIWVSEGGAPMSVIETISGNTNSYDFKVPTDGVEYCFVVRAVEENTGVISNSNEICRTPDIVKTIEHLFIKNVFVNEFNSIEIEWGWDIEAELKSYNILRSTDNVNFELVAAQTAMNPHDDDESFADNSIDPGSGKIYYKIEVIDNCDSTFSSISAPSIHLTGTAQSNQINQIVWTAMNIENASNINYELYKEVAVDESLIAEYANVPTPHLDHINPGNPAEAISCYYVIATAEVFQPNTGEIEMIKSRSNRVCVEQFAKIIAPNAFAPNGRNQEFRPLIILSQVADYQMLIYNRWGEKIFESNSINIGWNGKKNGLGAVLPQGSYLYHIRLTQTNGRVVENQGVVILLR